MKTAVFVFAALLTFPGIAASAPYSIGTVHSSSGQFIVQGRRPTPSDQILPGQTSSDRVVQLDTDLLTVSCERIKQAVLRILDTPDNWRGRIKLELLRYATAIQDIRITSMLNADVWHYQVELPEQIEPEKLVRGIVRVLLLEMANRNAGTRSAELPLWLVEGLARYLLAEDIADLILRPQTGFALQFVKPDPLLPVRKHLSAHAPLSFTELSLPGSAQLAGENWRTYQLCSQLFLTDLLRMKDGRAALLDMLHQLPQHLNWQTAFLNAFRVQFPRMLEVEKWWAVNLANFTGRDPASTWPRSLSLQKIDEILHSPAEVSFTSQDLPERKSASLQQIVAERSLAQQQGLLRQKINQLYVLRFNVPPELASLVDNYRLTLESYLAKRERAGYEPAIKGQPLVRVNYLVEEVVRRLNELDRQRAVLSQTNAAPASAAANR